MLCELAKLGESILIGRIARNKLWVIVGLYIKGFGHDKRHIVFC